MGTTYNPAIVTDGLVLCLDAANQRSYPKSGTTWSDLAGANNGTLTNGPTFSSDNGGSIVFDGANDYVNTTFNPFERIGNGNDWSVSVWMNQPSAKNNARVFGNSIASRFYVATSTTVVFWGFGSTFSTATAVTIPFGQWLHAAFTYNSSASEVCSYRNGILTATTTYTGNGVFADLDCQIGDITSNSLPFKGKISNTSIYNRALSADEIRQNYEATVGRYT